MLTPSFRVDQTNELLVVTIHAPYTSLNDVEINALDSELIFYSSPYFLRLCFPCEVQDDNEPPAKFDADKGDFEVKIRKQQPGQYFPDLDLLGTLLAPSRKKGNIKPSIEVLSAGAEEVGDSDVDDDNDDEWLFKQELPAESSIDLLVSQKYGFGNLTQGVFHKVQTEFKEIIDLPNPDGTSISQRDELRKVEEDKNFSEDHYIADFMEIDYIEASLSYNPHWNVNTCSEVKLDETEKECLKKLGSKEYLLNKEEGIYAWLSLVDIIFSYAYNHRTTQGENHVESAWTIRKLSATLSWFTGYTSLQSVVITCFRRALTYPQFRHWELNQLVLKDTIEILKSGRRQVLKCLLEIHSLFSTSESHYFLNLLYITDYCIWIQKASSTKLAQISKHLEKVIISKHDVGFNLEILEKAAILTLKEENDEEVLTKKVKNIDLGTSDLSTSTDSILDSDDESSSGTSD